MDSAKVVDSLLFQCKKQGIVEKQLFYVVELLEAINNDQFSASWLYNVKKYEKFEAGIPVISELLRLFEDIVNVNSNRPLGSAAVNRIVSQFVNIITLSRSDTSNLSNLRYCLLRLQEEYLNPDVINSPGYSQEGEDLVLKRLFPAEKKGFFIDVGAHHPTRFSNTYYFYQRGWRGINIDPLPGSIDLFEAMRPQDINLQVAVGSGKEDHDTAEYLLFEEPAYNCLMMNDREQQNLQSSRIVDRIQVPLTSLNAILDQNVAAFKAIDLLSIDVEGYEDAVFAGFSLEKYLPQVIVVEIRGFSLDRCNDFPLYKYIIGMGYRLRSILFHSLIFHRTDS